MAQFVKGARGPFVGLDIGSNYIKVVEARLGRDRAEVTALGVLPTPTDAMANNVVLDPQALGQAIKDLLQKSGVSSRRVVSSVAGQSSLVIRILPVPKMTVTELRETMKWEVERQVPFPADQTVMDYQPLAPPDQVPDGENMEVLLAVAQQDLINSHVATLQAAGLNPVAIEIEPLAASHSLIELIDGEGGPQGVVALVDLGANTTDITIFRDGLIGFTRSTPLAGNALSRAISEQTGQPMDQAERLKKELGSIPEGAGSAMAPEFDTGFGGGFGTETTASPLQYGAAPEPPPAGAYDFAGGGLGGGRGFSETAEGPMFDLGVSPDEDAAQARRPVLEFSDEPDLSPFSTIPGSQGASPPPAGYTPSAVPAPLGSSDEEALRAQVAEAILPILSELVTELRRSMDYYRSQSGASVERMLISGGTAKLPGLASFLSDQLGVSVEVADPMRNVAVVAKTDATYLSDVAPIFPISLGLAVREMLADTPLKGTKAS
jgi:type IV pilus assembly protein PilM